MSSPEKTGSVSETTLASSEGEVEVGCEPKKMPSTNDPTPEARDDRQSPNPTPTPQSKRPSSNDDRRGSKTSSGGRRQSRRTSTQRRSSAGSDSGVSSWFHWDIFGGRVVDDDMGVPVSEELGLYFEWAETRVKCYDTHARRVAMKSHRLWKNEYKVRSDPRMTFRVRRFDGVAGDLICGWHIINGSVLTILRVTFVPI